MDIYTFLAQHGITYHRCDHPAVYTCEEAERLVPPLDGAHTKNLFLRDRKGKRHFLVSIDARKTIDLKALSQLMEIPRLGMASPERLLKYLGIEPGAVSLLSILNDTDGAVEVVVDRELWEAESFCCHPLVNTATLVISKPDLEKFMAASGHSPTIIDIP